MQQRVRMGMVGGGGGAFIGAVHRMAAALDGQFELVCGAFSRDEQNNRQTGAQLGLSPERLYAGWQQLLAGEALRPASERMQVLVIVTPNQLHVPISLAASQAGFAVFCEKPAGVSLAETRQLAAQLLRAQSLYALAHTYLGYPMVWQARHLVATGAIGRLRKIFVEYPQGWLTDNLEASAQKQASWRTDPAQAGSSGCMADIGTHAFGLAEFISGQQINRLLARLGSHIDGRRLDDDGAAFFDTDGGASGVLIASQICAGEENALKIRLYGDRGGLEWQQMEPNTLLLKPHGAPVQLQRAGTGQSELSAEALKRCRLPAGHPEGYLEAMANLYRDFASAVRARAACAEFTTPAGPDAVTAAGVPGIVAALRGMAFIEAMVQSNQSGQWQQISPTEALLAPASI